MGATAWTILDKLTVAAAAQIISEKDLDVDLSDVKDNLFAVLAEATEEVRQEWADAVETHMPEAFMKMLITAQATTFAVRGLQQAGYL